MKMMKVFIFIFSLGISNGFSATFDSCLCEVTYNDFGGKISYARLWGKSFVKKVDGSVTLQSIYLGMVFDGEGKSDVAKICEENKKELQKNNVCPLN